MAEKAKSRHEKEKAPWITYRPQIKVLDCTIRDGGLMNNHKFDDQVVKAVHTACVEAGIDYMELGYKASQKIIVPGEHGAWKYCREEDMRRKSLADREKAYTDAIVARRTAGFEITQEWVDALAEEYGVAKATLMVNDAPTTGA